MTKNNTITAGQLFCMLFISRMVVNITYSPYMATSGEMLDHVVSAALSIFFTIFMALPIYFLYRRRPACNLADNAYALTGKFFGLILTGVYGLYFLFVCAYTLSLYETFVTNVITPNYSLPVLAAAVLATACYGAWKGVEALARTSGVIIVIVIACLVFMVCALVPEMDPLNYTPLLYEGSSSMWNGVKKMIGRTSCVAMAAMLLPVTKGKIKKNFLIWTAAIYGVTMILISVIVGALGDFLKTQIFPIYAAATVADLGAFQRNDALFFAVWTSSLFIKISLGLYLFSLCVKKVLGEKAGKISVFVGAFAVLAYGIWSIDNGSAAFHIYQMDLLFWITLTITAAIPLILLLIELVKHRKEKGYET